RNRTVPSAWAWDAGISEGPFDRSLTATLRPAWRSAVPAEYRLWHFRRGVCPRTTDRVRRRRGNSRQHSLDGAPVALRSRSRVLGADLRHRHRDGVLLPAAAGQQRAQPAGHVSTI